MRRSALLVLACLAVAIGCSDSSSTGPDRGPIGVYELRLVDESSPPVKIHHGPYFDDFNGHFYDQLIVRVTGGTIDIDENGRFSMIFQIAYVGDDVPGTGSLRLVGEYELWDDAIDFLPDGVPNAALSASLVHGAIALELDFMQLGNFHEYTFRR